MHGFCLAHLPPSPPLPPCTEHYFIKSEHSIVHYFHRHFYWFANILWAHDLHAPSAVVMAEHDGIVPVPEVERYLAHEGSHAVRRVQTLTAQSHGSFLVDADARQTVLTTIRDAQDWARSGRKKRRSGDASRVGAKLRKLLWWRLPISRAASRPVTAALDAPRAPRGSRFRSAVGRPFVSVREWWRASPRDVDEPELIGPAADSSHREDKALVASSGRTR